MIWSSSVVLSILLFMKIVEHSISRANETWLRERGGVNNRAVPYGWLAALQLFFFISLFLEAQLSGGSGGLQPFWLAVVLCGTGLKIWCMRSKGFFWNLKGMTLPRISLLRQGPYKYVRHPEYWILGVELMAIPLAFGLHVTMVLFLLLHSSIFIVNVPGQPRNEVL